MSCEHVWVEDVPDDFPVYCSGCRRFRWWVEASRLYRGYYRVRRFLWHLPPRVCVVHMLDEADQAWAVAVLWWFRWRRDLARVRALSGS